MQNDQHERSKDQRAEGPTCDDVAAYPPVQIRQDGVAHSAQIASLSVLLAFTNIKGS
jgi:hypothetical protein